MTRSEALKRAQKKYYLKKKDQIFNQQKQYKKKNKQKTNEFQKKYRSKNSESLKRAQKQYYLKKKDQILNQQKQYKKKNKLKTNEAIKKWRLKNVEKVREFVRKSYQKNKIKKKIYMKIYTQKRRKTDPVFRLMGNIRTRFNLFLNSKKIHKKNKTFDLVGCTPEELKEYIEKKFLPGMSWDNYRLNTWNIDHIKPLSLAKNIDDIIRLKLMHYTNLQPLWALENMVKSNKYVEKKLDK